MATPQHLPLSNYDSQFVLLPGREDRSIEGVRITIYGEHFPIRALEPEILVGELQAEMVTVAPDQRSITGYLTVQPHDGAPIRVRYGQSQEGVLESRFDSSRIRQLPETF